MVDGAIIQPRGPSGQSGSRSTLRSQSAAASAQGAAVQRLGSVFGQIANHEAKKQEKFAFTQQREAINDLSRSALMEFDSELKRMQREDMQPGAEGFAQGFSTYSEGWIDEKVAEFEEAHGDKPGGEEAVSGLRDRLEEIAWQNWRRADGIELSEFERFQTENARDTAKAYAQQAIEDPDGAQSYYEEGLKSIDEMQISEARKEQLRDDFGREFAAGLATSILRNDPGNMDDKLDDPIFRENLTPSQIEGYKERAENEVERQEAEAERDRAKAEAEAEKQAELDRQWAYEDKERAIKEGRASREDIERWREDGSIKPNEYGALQSIVDQRQAAEQKAQVDFGRVESALAGETILDPGSAEDREAVDIYFEHWAARPELSAPPVDATPEDRAQFHDRRATAIAEFVERVNIVPNALESQIRTGMLSDDPEIQAQTADIVARIDAIGGPASDSLAEKDVATARMISEMTRAGVPAEKAVERAQQLVDPESKATVEKRETDFNDFAEITTKDIANQFDGWFSFEPEVPTNVAADLEREANGIFRRQYLITGDEKLSREYAMSQIKKSWGVSEINGRKQMMKHPPEAYYGIGGDNDWMQEQLHADVAALGTVDDETLSEGSFIIVSDARTARSEQFADANGNVVEVRTYPVVVQNPDGTFSPVLDEDGVEMRWYPDSKRAHGERAQSAIDRGRQQRNQAAVMEILPDSP